MKVLVVLIVLFGAGCSTVPVSLATAQPAQERHLFDLGKRLSIERPECAKVTFVRDKGFLGSACTDVIKVNGEQAFALDPGEFYTLFLNSGDYFFTRAFGAGMCPNTEISQHTKLRAGDEQVYRLSMNVNGQAMLTRIK